ncbi:peptidoglycan D,D-transpeptidase FtsI family protein [Thermanaeromonas sp. C210]|uniref:peptidoglycan D,D-transpeptidase FtsI family protein n=1 Tax=Thermanaeromonas sp. C210 TaxID=2731925 RepID=UPI00155C921E|nr:penicillin-binding transpeptidase domain-containing protein [Thermanaeromonas sp. C210]GFN24010.1 peptidoglycan glycosyltransferase [Thermanaeromonas sp. C210]
MEKPVRLLALVLSSLFLLLILHLTYIQVLKGEELYLNPFNPRLRLLEEKTWRGQISGRHGEVWARTYVTGGRLQREYPLGAAAAHVVGYASPRLGMSGLEAGYNGELLGLTGWQGVLNRWRELQNTVRHGNNLVLTLDASLQQLAFQLLKGYRGAVVALNPQTGEVLALASSPSFDPHGIENAWDQLNDARQGSPLLNRALQGLYPPGSTLKLITAAAALGEDYGISRREFYCPGHIEIEGRKLTCPRVHGNINFNEALMFSCNVTFAQLALEAGAEAFERAARNFALGQELDFDLNVASSRFPATVRSNPNALAEAAIGQGEFVATPLHMALVAAALANNGRLMQPFMVARVEDEKGAVLKVTRPRLLKLAADPAVALIIKEAMVATVEEGTGQSARIPGIRVAGKTGSAQNPQGRAHSWFVGFAPAEAPQVAVAVIVENAGAGGAVAAPIGGQIMAKVLGR